jgi:hypothetical protein
MKKDNILDRVHDNAGGPLRPPAHTEPSHLPPDAV